MNIKYPVLMLTISSPSGGRMFGHFSLRESHRVSLIDFVKEAINNGDFDTSIGADLIEKGEGKARINYHQVVNDLGFLLSSFGSGLDMAQHPIAGVDARVPNSDVGANAAIRLQGWALVVRVAHNDFQVMEGMKLWGIPLEETASLPNDLVEPLFQVDPDATFESIPWESAQEVVSQFHRRNLDETES